MLTLKLLDSTRPYHALESCTKSVIETSFHCKGIKNLFSYRLSTASFQEKLHLFKVVDNLLQNLFKNIRNGTK